ncbi:MAG: SDR family oxidoreductase [Candidatus Edwardsbacteria bacterium]|jgi:nucleoside-diphosphate-sugar epimerase|nr:SDR family oxidoreductase [Candidatus Edwardsbacteria bacterium]
MRILLAGGAGYIGSMLAPALLDHGYKVEVIDLCWFGNMLPDAVKVTRKNLFDCTERDLEGFDQLVFLAGLSNDPMAEYSPANNFIYNGALPSYLAYIAKRVGVWRYIYASSCSVYGYTVNQLYDEESPVTCAYPYGISKLQGERGVLQLHDDSFSVIALRQGTVCGHSPRMRFDLIVNTMFKSAMTEGRIIVNNPAIWRPIYDLRDAVNAYFRAIQAGGAVNGVFNVTSGNYTVGQVADLVKHEVETLTDRHIAIEMKNIEDFRNYKVTCEKAKTELGFQPIYDIPDIVADLYAHRPQYGDYGDDRFYNIKTFKNIKL